MSLPGAQWLATVFGISELGLLWWRRSRGAARSADEGSLRLLWRVIVIAIALGLAAAALVPAAALAPSRALAAVACAVFLCGLLLRWYAIFHLGRYFTVDVAIAADHSLVDTGPYRLIRHPSYTGALLALLGIALASGNALTLLLVMLPVSWAFMRRIAIEEAALTQALGAPYRDYIARTRRLLPFLL